eukprot:COSAG02_NODE_1878_length_10554_cov_95.091918_1_plen_93_part_10
MRSIAGAQEERRSTDSIRAAAERSLTICSAIRPTAAHPDSNDITVSNTASRNTISRTHARREKDKAATMRSIAGAQKERRSTDSIRAAAERSL